MAIATKVEVTFKDRKTHIVTCKSRAEARRYCEEKNARYALLRKAGREGYEYASARILD